MKKMLLRQPTREHSYVVNNLPSGAAIINKPQATMLRSKKLNFSNNYNDSCRHTAFEILNRKKAK